MRDYIPPELRAVLADIVRFAFEDEDGRRAGAPTHCHHVPGKWDGDRSHPAGSVCLECAAWDQLHVMLDASAPPVAHDYRADLQTWFGLSYASWLTMPRVLMEAMPSDWQSRIAPLLGEYSEAWDTGRLAAPYVLARNGNKFTSWPEWVLNYRHPDATAINAVRSPVCSCPSGDGSLCWPCAVHGAGDAQQGKEKGAGE